jgi:hypothetical protein
MNFSAQILLVQFIYLDVILRFVSTRHITSQKLLAISIVK